MLPRRLTTIVQMQESHRFSVLAEGMALLAENVATLEADATTLSAARRDRGAAVLRSFAEEEAAKVLIMFDLARAGWKDRDTISSCLRAFYTHISRGLYGRAYDGSPADFAEVRRYVDVLRQEYYLDVMSREVVEPGGRRGADRGVDAMMIVEVQPSRQRGPALRL